MEAFLEYLQRFWTDLIGRTDGPMTFRFFLQPSMALLMALRDGIKDAKAGREPYAIFLKNADAAARKAGWEDGIKSVSRIIVLGIGMDIIYQYKVFGGYRYPLETVIIVFALAFLPYLLFRGPMSRLARHWMKRD